MEFLPYLVDTHGVQIILCGILLSETSLDPCVLDFFHVVIRHLLIFLLIFPDD